MDFTIKIYRELLLSLITANYGFEPFSKFVEGISSKRIVLRHDVDLLPNNSLRFAKIQAELGIKGSYYFRAVPESWDENIIKEIAVLGHEVGYHYENMDTCNGDVDKAWDDFRLHLDKLRKLVDVKTICMHGSPRSKFDNKEIWNKYDYRSLQIIGEPYYDVDFDEIFYLTDTGRRWDGWKASVRDKVPQQDQWVKQGLTFHSTQDIIDAVNSGRALSGAKVPSKIMFTMHPQRWTEGGLPWLKELVLQNVKNQVKKVLILNNSK
ncbi:hypothetical protein OAE13_03635 [Flavobacteriaceae bacterium]|nr:hypothetical protein [Flavobacteriaceae bacterium]